VEENAVADGGHPVQQPGCKKEVSQSEECPSLYFSRT
jgi:hypothetical protein